MEQTAIKTASELLRRLYHSDNSTDDTTFVCLVEVMEKKNETEFFLSRLDDVIAFCNKLKVAISEESKPIILE